MQSNPSPPSLQLDIFALVTLSLAAELLGFLKSWVVAYRIVCKSLSVRVRRMRKKTGGGEAIHFPLEGVNNIATDVFGPGPKGLPRLRTTYAENCLMLIPYPAYLLSQCLRDNAYTVVLTAILQDNISDPRGDIIDPYYPIGESYKEASRTREN